MNKEKSRKKKIVIVLLLFLIFLSGMIIFLPNKSYVTFSGYQSAGGKIEIKNNKVVKPEDPVKEGYIFVGWYLDGKLFNFNTIVHQDIKLVAKFEKIKVKTYNVTFDTKNGTSIDIQKVEENGFVVEPFSPVKEGYTFLGWYLGNQLFDFNTKIKSNLILVAKFEKNDEKQEASTQEKDITKPALFTPTFDVSWNRIVVHASTMDNSTPAAELIYRYSLDGVAYQNSPVFTNLQPETYYSIFISVQDKAGNVRIVQARVKTNQRPLDPDKTIPEKFVPTFDVTWHSILVHASTTDNVTAPSKLVYQYSMDGIHYQDSSIFESLEENTKYQIYVSVRDEAGNVRFVQASVKTTSKPIIPDTEKPAEFEPTFEVTTHSIVISASTIDNETPTDELVYQYSIDGTNYQDSNIFENLEQNKEYTIFISVTDKAGNERIVKREASTKKVPKPTDFTITPDTYTSSSIDIEYSVNPLYTLQYSLDGINYINYTDKITVTKNGTIYFRQYDKANQYSEVYIIDIKTIISSLSIQSFSGTSTTKSIQAKVSVNLDMAYIQSIDYSINDQSSSSFGTRAFTQDFTSLKQNHEYIISVIVTSVTGQKEKAETSVYTKELVTPTIQLKDTDWVRDTTAMIKYTKSNSGDEFSYEWNGSTENVSSTSASVDIIRNGVLTARVSDGYNEVQKSLTIDNIDRIKPYLTKPIAVIDGISKVTLSVDGDDDESGVVGYQFALIKESADEDSAVYGEVKKAGVAVFTDLEKDTKYKIKIKVLDRVGNYYETEFVKFETGDFTTVTVEIDKDSWSSKKYVTIDLGNLSPDYKYEYQKNDGTWVEITSSPVIIEFDKNGNITIKITDRTNGNATSSTVEVSNIDSIVPTIQANPDEIVVKEGTDALIKDYFTTAFGASGGNVTCGTNNVKELSPGSHTVTCKARSNAGLKASNHILIHVKSEDPEQSITKPMMVDGMIAVEIRDDGTIVTADLYDEWYDYKNQKWANVVTFDTEEKLDQYQNAKAGTVVSVDDIHMMYVWIPRYQYSLFNVDGDSYNIKPISIQFQDINSKSDGTCDGTYSDYTNGCYLTHPAFTRGNQELSGVWINKFELSGEKSGTTITRARSVPGAVSLRQTSLSSFVEYGNQYYQYLVQNPTLSKGIKPNVLTDYEWAAASYLSYSIYGICNDFECSKVEGNQSKAFYTGNYNNTNDFSSALGVLTSTTHNEYGIYDLAGGCQEMTMGTTDISQLKDISELPYYIDFKASSMIGSATTEVAGTTSNPGWYGTIYSPFTSNYNQKWYSRGGDVYNLNSNVFISVLDGIGGGAKNSSRYSAVSTK